MNILTKFSDAALNWHYKSIQRELKAGETQMDSEFWFRDKKNLPLHKDPITPADVIQEYERRAKDKSKGLMEY